ncbi:A24 family peptidase [Candidatus Burkholderia verschuerenii]|uniref:A24 family peptidase n=1 Tax=Candidatus Burkholderia verschuerenii TaxID=242163 RepID=UPI00067B9FF9|nr:prepilin peptidase [Candidatus Burkholderia verschuerenii]
MLILSLLLRAVVICLLARLAICDLRERRLPTREVVAIAVLFPIDALLGGMPLTEMAVHFAIGVLILLVSVALFAARMLGGGDAKLSAAIFLWVGMTGFIQTLTLVSVIGTIVGLVSFSTRHLPPESEQRGLHRSLALFSGARGVPYGVALALGGSVTIMLPGALAARWNI